MLRHALGRLRRAASPCTLRGLSSAPDWALRGSSVDAATQAAFGFAAHLSRSPYGTAEALAQALEPTQRELLVAALLRAARPPPGGDQTPQEAMFSAADLNGDGLLSRAEFQAAAAHSPQFAAVVASHAHATAPPTRSQLVRAGLVSAVPFLGFGFCDNSIMILSGETIEATVGVALSLSTMAAAGCGNMVSDVVGIGLSGWIERTCDRLGFRHGLSASQLALRQTQAVITASRCIGVGIGCTLGMAPLLFMSHEAAAVVTAVAT